MAFAGKSILAIIPARGGSKGLPRKNLLPLGGKPLIAWTIEAARASKTIDRLILTSDDEEIMTTAEGLGCEVPFARPAPLAGDETPMAAVVEHALDSLERGYDYLVLLQPTVPGRRGEDIDAAVARCIEAEAPACVTLCEAEENPHWMFRLDDAGRLAPLLDGQEPPARRQDLPRHYLLNGAVYVAACEWFRERRSFFGEGAVGQVMPRERSLDIDTAEDLELARRQLERGAG